MAHSSIEEMLATATPFDDVFDRELLLCGELVEPLPIRTQCGRRINLQARLVGWCVQGLREVIDDAQANWTGHDDAAWELDAQFS